jgi:hypothetical protein
MRSSTKSKLINSTAVPCLITGRQFARLSPAEQTVAQARIAAGTLLLVRPTYQQMAKQRGMTAAELLKERRALGLPIGKPRGRKAQPRFEFSLDPVPEKFIPGPIDSSGSPAFVMHDTTSEDLLNMASAREAVERQSSGNGAVRP